MDDLDTIRVEAADAALNRVLDLLLPARTRGGVVDDTRTKLRAQLASGRLDDRQMEVELAAEPHQTQPAKSEPRGENSFDLALEDFVASAASSSAAITETALSDYVCDHFSRALVPRPLAPVRVKRMTVREAREMFSNEEFERLRTVRTAVDYQGRFVASGDDIVAAHSHLLTGHLLTALRRNPALLHEISHRQFEEFLHELLSDLGYDVGLTARTRDGGCDLIAFSTDRLGLKTKYVIEAKHYRLSNKVGVGTVRQLSAVRQKFGAHHGLLVTTSYLTADAIDENRSYYGLHLRDYDKILEWLRS